MVYIAGVLNCEIANNLVHFVSQDTFDFLMSFHGQVTAVNVITGNLNGGKADFPFIAADGAVEDVGDVDFFHLFSEFLCRPLGNKITQLALGFVLSCRESVLQSTRRP